MTESANLEIRCAPRGVGCCEVVDRSRAAEIARYVFHDDAAADQLLATARRFAELHNYGNDDDAQARP